MPVLNPDNIDWRAFERQTEASVKVLPASLYADQLDAQFVPRERANRRPRMSSTKLGRDIEFRPAEATVWAGYNGHRKSLATSQTMLDLCAQGERCLAMSFEMLPGMTLARMARQASGIAVPSQRWREAFMRWTDDRLWILNHMGRFSPRQCIAMCRYFANELAGTHVFVDSMMMVCESEESLDEQKQLMTDLIGIAQETDLHIHLVAHCKKPLDEKNPPTKYDIRGSSAISDQAHNIIMVWANLAKKEGLERNPHDEALLEKPDALLRVQKQRNGAFEGNVKLWWDEHSFRFLDDRGSAIEPFPIEETA